MKFTICGSATGGLSKLLIAATIFETNVKIEFFVVKPILSDLVILCRLGWQNKANLKFSPSYVLVCASLISSN